MTFNLATIALGFCMGVIIANTMVSMIVTIIGWRLHVYR